MSTTALTTTMHDAVESLSVRFERLRDEAIPKFCDVCRDGWPHSRHMVSGNSETFRAYQLRLIKSLYEDYSSEYNLQDLFDACCEVFRYGMNSRGYQAEAADAVGRIIGRTVYEEKDVDRLISRRTPSECFANLSTSEVCRGAGLVFEGWSKKFYLLRDIANVMRGVPRVKCASCGKRYDGWCEPNTPDWRNKWRDFVIPSRSSRNTSARHQWSCSWPCFLKLQRQLDKEIKWLRIARQKQTEVRRYLRSNRAA